MLEVYIAGVWFSIRLLSNKQCMVPLGFLFEWGIFFEFLNEIHYDRDFSKICIDKVSRTMTTIIQNED